MSSGVVDNVTDYPDLSDDYMMDGRLFFISSEADL